MKNALVTLLLFAGFTTQAAVIQSAIYNAETNSIDMNITHQGGCKKHLFALEIGSCLESFPVQCRNVQLLEDSQGDTCEAANIPQSISIPLSETALNNPYYKGATLIINGDFNSSAEVKLPFRR